MRKVALLIVVAAIMTLTSGCTVPDVGASGIGVDPLGNPVGYLRVCERHQHVDAAVVYTDGTDDTRGRWTAAVAITDVAIWPLTGPAQGWTTETALKPLITGTLYNLYGATTDNSASTAGVSFTAADLAAMKPGQVRYTPASSDVPVVVGETEFRTRHC
jgi:hypothetical protein